MNVFKLTTCTDLQGRQSRVIITSQYGTLHYWKLSSDASISIITRNIVPFNPSLPKVSPKELCILCLMHEPEETASDIRQQVIRYLNKALKIFEESQDLIHAVMKIFYLSHHGRWALDTFIDMSGFYTCKIQWVASTHSSLNCASEP
jgi:hypothetical protein